MILRATVLTRPSMLVVVPSTSAGPPAASTTSACCGRRGEEAVDGDHRAGAGQRAGGQVGVGEVGERIGAEQHEHVDLARGGRLQDAGGVEAALADGTVGQPRPRNHAPPSSRVVRPGSRPGREAHVEGAVHVAAPQRAEEAHLGVGGVDGGRGGDDAVGGLGQVGAAEHDGDRAGGEQARRRRRWRRARCRRPPGWPSRRAGLATTSPAAPGRWSSVAAASSDDGRALRGQLHDRDAVAHDGVAQAEEEDGQLLLEVGREEQHRAARARRPRRSWRGAGRARPRRGARRRAGRRRGRCRSRPWPAWPRRRRSRW